MSKESVRHYISFLKVGEKKHMEDLINEGYVFCKPLKYFTQIEKENHRGDPNEGAAYINQLANLEFTVEEKVIGNANKGQLYFWHQNNHGNIYCLYGIETHTVNFESNLKQNPNINMNRLRFGDTAILIYKPGEFIQRVKKSVESQGFSFHCHPVNYYESNSYNGKLSLFYKSNNYEDQNEVRFWIPNRLDKDLIFKIGNISDISYLLPKENINKIEYEPW